MKRPLAVGTVDRGLFDGARCVVTGGLGFIGSNLSLALAAAGAEVTVIDASVPTLGANPCNLKGAAAPINVVHADIGDREAIAPALAGVDRVFNLAGQVSHIDALGDPAADFDMNARSHLIFLETLRRVAPGTVVVHASTRLVYGRSTSLPVDESHPCRPVDVNGATKLAGEQLHFAYQRMYGLRVSSLRLCNVFGPRQRISDDTHGVLPAFVRRALRKEPLTVFGAGEQLRDCLYVDDAVEAFLAASASPAADGEVFNISHEEPVSLRAIAEAMVTVVGGGCVTSVPWPQQHARIDVGSYFGDSSKVRRVLGWRPSVSFEEGLVRTFEFYREDLGCYLPSA